MTPTGLARRFRKRRGQGFEVFYDTKPLLVGQTGHLDQLSYVLVWSHQGEPSPFSHLLDGLEEQGKTAAVHIGNPAEFQEQLLRLRLELLLDHPPKPTRRSVVEL